MTGSPSFLIYPHMTEHPTARTALYLPPSTITQLLDASGVSNRSVFGRDASDGAPHVSDILADERTVETDGLANFRTYGPFRLKEESSSGSGFAVCRYRLSPLLGSRVTPKKKNAAIIKWFTHYQGSQLRLR